MENWMTYRQYEYIEGLVWQQFDLKYEKMGEFWKEYRANGGKRRSEMTTKDASDLIEKLKSDREWMLLISNRLSGSLD